MAHPSRVYHTSDNKWPTVFILCLILEKITTSMKRILTRTYKHCTACARINTHRLQLDVVDLCVLNKLKKSSKISTVVHCLPKEKTETERGREKERERKRERMKERERERERERIKGHTPYTWKRKHRPKALSTKIAEISACYLISYFIH